MQNAVCIKESHVKIILTLKEPSKIAADDTFIFFTLSVEGSKA